MPRVIGMRWGRKSTASIPGLALGCEALAQRDDGQLLLDLGDMAVATDAVRRDALVDLAEEQVRLGLATGARDAALGVDHEVADQAGPRERRQGQQGRGRVAAGRADDRDRCVDQGLELGAMELRQPVDRVVEEVGPRMLEAVPARVVVRVAQAEVGAEVDDGGARPRRDRRRPACPCRGGGPGRPRRLGRRRGFRKPPLPEMPRPRWSPGNSALSVSAVVARCGCTPPMGSWSRSRPTSPTSSTFGWRASKPDQLATDIPGRPDDPDPDAARPAGWVDAALRRGTNAASSRAGASSVVVTVE